MDINRNEIENGILRLHYKFFYYYYYHLCVLKNTCDVIIHKGSVLEERGKK